MAKRRSGKGRSQGKKVRVDLRRNQQTRARQQNLTQDLLDDEESAADVRSGERSAAKAA